MSMLSASSQSRGGCTTRAERHSERRSICAGHRSAVRYRRPVEETTTAWGDARARRRDILRSAEELLAGSGYAGLTMRAIAVGAGVSSGTLYQYFGGKEDVFVALMSARLEALATTLDRLDRGGGIAGLCRGVL